MRRETVEDPTWIHRSAIRYRDVNSRISGFLYGRFANRPCSAADRRKAGDHKGRPYNFEGSRQRSALSRQLESKTKDKRQKAKRRNHSDSLRQSWLECLSPARWWGRGFSARVRSARKSGNACKGFRATAHLLSTEAIRGKTGPAPSGAVLFGPFSWAYKKKDEGKKKVDW